MASGLFTVILVSPIPPPAGGIATWTQNLLSFWQEKNEHEPDVTLLHVSNARRFGNITNRNSLVRVVTGILNGLFFLSNFIFTIGSGRRRQLVHLTTSGSFGFLRDLLVTFLARLSGSKIILHLRFGRVPELMQNRNWEYLLLNLLLKRSYKVISIDTQTFEVLRRAYGEKIVYLPNAVSPLFTAACKEHFLKNTEVFKTPTILFVGHVVKSKGIFDLIRVAGEIGHVNLRIAGISKSSELVTIAELQSCYPTLQIDILGNLPPEGLIIELQSCTVFCLPSYTEGFPNAVLEAMAVGAPIVASDVGEIAEMVKVNNQTAAWLFRPGDLEGLKMQLDSALTDPAERIRKSRLCIQKVNSTYTRETVFNKLLQIWKTANQ